MIMGVFRASKCIESMCVCVLGGGGGVCAQQETCGSGMLYMISTNSDNP